MYLLNDEEQEKRYSELMDNIKKINMDWITIYKSEEYKTGRFFFELKKDIKKFKVKSICNSLKRKIRGKKNRKVKSENMIKSEENKEYYPNYFSNERIAIYTSVFGNYDKLIEPLFVPNNCDFFVITDLEINENSIWKKIEYPKEIENMTNVEKNRYVKINPHYIFKDYKYSIYLDGNIQIVSDLTEYINLLNEIGIGVHLHHLRNCVYDELQAVEKSKKDTKENIIKHRNYLLETNMPKNYGLLQCSVIVREHNNPNCIKLMEEWWDEFKNYSNRDQISFPHVLFKNNIQPKKIGILGNNIYNNPSFRIFNHNV